MDLLYTLWVRARRHMDTEWLVVCASVLAIAMFVAGMWLPGDQGMLIAGCYGGLLGLFFFKKEK